MILAFDTYYFENKAKTICVAFENWTDEKPKQVFTSMLEGIEEYEPGAFYKRELPCIIDALMKINAQYAAENSELNIEMIVIDGFVVLNDEGKLGLGGYLFEHLARKIPIIGVAKTNFAQLDQLKRPLLRGGSQRPLFITALGIDIIEATEYVNRMHGEFRMPTLLKLMDTLTKET